MVGLTVVSAADNNLLDEANVDISASQDTAQLTEKAIDNVKQDDTNLEDNNSPKTVSTEQTTDINEYKTSAINKKVIEDENKKTERIDTQIIIDPSEYVVDIDSNLNITGILVDANAKPIQNERIFVTPSTGGNDTILLTTDAGGNFVCPYHAVSPGSITLLFVYHPSGWEYNSSEKIVFVTVRQKTAVLTIGDIPDDLHYNDNLTLSATLTDDEGIPLSNDEVSINYNNNEYICLSDNNGLISHVIHLNNLGNNIVTFTYSNPSYATITENLIFTVKDFTAINNYNISSPEYSDNVRLSGRVIIANNYDNLTIGVSTVTITLNDEAPVNVTTDFAGFFTCDLPTKKVGLNYVTYYYVGNDLFEPSRCTTTFEVIKKDTLLTINNVGDIEYSDVVNVTGKFTRDTGVAIKNAPISLMIDNETHSLKTDADGNYRYSFTATKIAGYNVFVSFAGNSVYNSASNNSYFMISKKDTLLTLDELSGLQYSDVVNVTGKFTRSTGVAIKNATITLTINEVSKSLKTDDTGSYRYSFTATKLEDYVVTASFNANSVYNGAFNDTQFTVVKKDTAITLNNLSYVEYSDVVNVSGRFTRSSGVAIKNAVIVVTVNGVSHNVKSDGEGYYSYSFTATKVGVNNVVVSFAGNSVYNAVNAASTFTVGKKETVMTIDPISTKQYMDDVVINGRFTRSTGVAIKNVQIILTINGQTYNTRTLADGTFIYTFTAQTRGVNNVTASFGGNSVYTDSTDEITFSVV